MDTETITEINKILFYIEEYENGNDEYYDAMLEIVKAIKSYKHTARKSYNRTWFVILVSKITTSLVNIYLKEEKVYQDIMTNVNEDLEFYIESSKSLEKYVKICMKHNAFPDLDAAYMLTIKLSLILDNIMNYIHEIRMMEKSSRGFFTYCPSSKVEKEAKENRRVVTVLVKALEKSAGELNV